VLRGKAIQDYLKNYLKGLFAYGITAAGAG
jgi:hypothetical protein